MHIKEEGSTSDKEFVATKTEVCGGFWDEPTANHLLQGTVMAPPISLMPLIANNYSFITSLQSNVFVMLPVIKSPIATCSTSDMALDKTSNPETQTSGTSKQFLDKSLSDWNNVQMCSNAILPAPSLGLTTTSIPTISIIPTTSVASTTSVIPKTSIKPKTIIKPPISTKPLISIKPKPSALPTTSITPTTSIVPTSSNAIVGKQTLKQLDVLPQINNTNASYNLAALLKATVPNKVVEVPPLVTISKPNINSACAPLSIPAKNDKNIINVLGSGRASPPPLVEIPRDKKNRVAIEQPNVNLFRPNNSLDVPPLVKISVDLDQNTVAGEKPKVNLFKQNNSLDVPPLVKISVALGQNTVAAEKPKVNLFKSLDVPPLAKISNKSRPDTKIISNKYCYGPLDSVYAAIDPPFCTKSAYNINLRQMGYYVKYLMPNSVKPAYVCKACNYTTECEDTIKKHAWFHTKTYECTACSNYFNDAYQFSLHIHADTRTRFECPACDFNTKKKNMLRSHISRIHLLSNDCIFCGITFTDRIELITHEQIHRMKEKSGLCEICGYTFKGGFQGVSIHHRTHTKRNLPKYFTCYSCNEKFTTKERLKLHKLSHKRPFYCDICQKWYKTRYDLRLHHRRSHAGKEHGYCPNCNMRFKFKSSLTKHYKKCQYLELFRCSYCDQRFLNPYKCTVHMQSHSNDLFECPLCDHKDKSKTNVLQHLVDVHSSAFRQICKYCGQNFTDSDLHAEHEDSHTGRREFKCIVCNKKFALSTRLHGHQILAHTVTIDGSEYKRKRFMCEVCGKSFDLIASLREHYHVHTAKRTVSCRFCDKLFCSKSRAKLHEKIHTQEKTNVCTYCGKRFLLLQSLRLHLVTHTGKYPHICHECGKGFRHKYDVKRHLKCGRCKARMTNKI